MNHIIHTPQDLGFALRAVRKSSKVRLDDLSQTVHLSKQTTANIEFGKPTVQIGNIIRIVNELGLTLSVNIPESALPAFYRLQQKAHNQLISEVTPDSAMSAGITS
jgi:transcriptional regulator with XRE-family HTH domain